MTSPAGRLILVVDDDPHSRAFLSGILKLEGYSVHTATDGAEGLKKARALQPCIILLDLMMPVLDGQGFRTQQTLDPLIADIPVVVISAHCEAAKIAREMGVAGCVPKPVMFEHLLASVAAVCG